MLGLLIAKITVKNTKTPGSVGGTKQAATQDTFPTGRALGRL
jgi:hypothetical protein